MQILFDQCKEIVEKAVASTSDMRMQRSEMGRLRDFVKTEIKRRKLVDNALNSSLPKVIFNI